MTREQWRAPPRHLHGDPTSLVPQERLTELGVGPREKPDTGGSARDKPRNTPSSRNEGLRFPHGLEHNPYSSLQTPQEEWFP